MGERFATADQVYQAFLPFANLEGGQDIGRFRLDRMEALCEALGRPERSFRSIHVAGSKGKGSLCAMMACILEESGHRTGIYASPHVHDWKERVTSPSGPFPEEAYRSAGELLMDLVDAWEDMPGRGELGKPTFFELMTALAFLVFRSQGCSWAVVETGLGGRLDSTNVLLPEASVIMPIELEHTEYLGDSIALIAAEKAGIIKAGRPVFLAPMLPEARAVMERKAEELGCALESSAEACALRDARIGPDGSQAILSLASPEGKPRRLLAITTAMTGQAMLQNAALAALVLDRLVPGLEEGPLGRGLARARLPARFEVLRAQPPLVLDGAHTAQSAALLARSWEACVQSAAPALLVFGCAADKNAAAMALSLGSLFERIVVTKPGNFKKSHPLAVFEAFRDRVPQAEILLLPETEEAFREILAWDGPVLVAGSFYLAAQIGRLYASAQKA